MERKKVTEENTSLVENLVAAVRNREPILKNPEGLTEDIMKAIHELSAENRSVKTVKSREIPVIIIIRRLLAAASVCLFLVFGYEEYVVVAKISRLEKQNLAISQSSRYQVALQLDKAVNIIASDPEVLNQYKEIKSRKMLLSTLFMAAIYYDFQDISPDALKFQDRTGYNVTRSAVISVLKQFDSTHYTILR